MTIRMVAERRKYKLDNCRIEIDHHIKGKGDDAYDVFTRRLMIEGDLSPGEHQFLQGIANKCPVHKSLEWGSEVKTVLES